MTNFNYRKFLTENKLTQTSKLRSGILAEGQFSWMTQDTGQQIGSEEENMIPVYMFDDKGNFWFEPNYEGYGDFGGMDYYELLDKMNGGRGDRGRGIDLAFGNEKVASRVLFPALVTRPNFNWKSHDFTKEAKHDPNQSWYAGSNDEDEDIYGDGSEEYMGEGIDQPEEQGKGPSITYPEYPETELAETSGNKEKIVKTLSGYYEIPAAKFNDFKLDGTGEDTKKLINFIVSQETPFIKKQSFDQIKKDIEGIIEKLNSTEPSSDEVYPYGLGKGQGYGKSYENKTTTKMKKSDLKTKIKEMIVAEMELDIQDTAKEASEYDFLAEVDAILAEADEEVAVDDTEVATDGTETIDTTTTAEVDPNVKAVQDALTQAQAAAQKLGDPKLTDQIGNTITFFTRAHVVEKGAVAEGEEMEEGKKEYYKDAEADDAEHIKALEKDMEDDKKSSVNESMFPLLKRILK